MSINRNFGRKKNQQQTEQKLYIKLKNVYIKIGFICITEKLVLIYTKS